VALFVCFNLVRERWTCTVTQHSQHYVSPAGQRKGTVLFYKPISNQEPKWNSGNANLAWRY